MSSSSVGMAHQREGSNNDNEDSNGDRGQASGTTRKRRDHSHDNNDDKNNRTSRRKKTTRRRPSRFLEGDSNKSLLDIHIEHNNNTDLFDNKEPQQDTMSMLRTMVPSSCGSAAASVLPQHRLFIVNEENVNIKLNQFRLILFSYRGGGLTWQLLEKKLGNSNLKTDSILKGSRPQVLFFDKLDFSNTKFVSQE